MNFKGFSQTMAITFDERIQNRRSKVRAWISALAMIFVFVGGFGMIAFLLLIDDDIDSALNVFNIVFPVATGVIGYWFAEATSPKNQPPQPGLDGVDGA